MGNTYSYSKLDTYQQCPFKFYLRYLQGYYVSASSIALECGIAIHRTEEQIAKSIIAGEAIDYTSLKNNLIKTMIILQNKYPKDFYTLDKAGKTYADKFYFYLDYSIYNLEKFMQDNPGYKIIGVEQNFEIQYKDQTFKGAIDRIFYDTVTNKYIIQDIKTYATEVEKSKLATPLQFVVYTLAAQKLYNCSPEQVQCQYYLPFCNIAQAAGTAGYMLRGMSKLDTLFNKITLQEFTPNNKNALCNYCEFCNTNPDATIPYKYLCPYHCNWDRTSKKKSDLFNIDFQWLGLEHNKDITLAYLQKFQIDPKLLYNNKD